MERLSVSSRMVLDCHVLRFWYLMEGVKQVAVAGGCEKGPRGLTEADSVWAAGALFRF